MPFLVSLPSSLPDGPGVYLFRDRRNKVIYVGQSSHLRQRLQSYLQVKRLGPKTQRMLQETSTVETIKVTSPLEAVFLETKLINKYRPKYNFRGKDDKSFLLIEIDNLDAIPTLSLTRRRSKPKAIYFGPFPRAWLIKGLLKRIRHVFPYCTCKKGYKKGCLYRQIGLCSSPHPDGSASAKRDYQKMMADFALFLEGNVGSYLKKIQTKMRTASQKVDYERASELKSQMESLNYLAQKLTVPEDYLRDPNLAEDRYQQALRSLAQTLAPHQIIIAPFSRIEAFDVSHLSGQAATGSMVVFRNGKPSPDLYRRFKIRGKKTKNDLAMISEILSRRFRQRPKADKVFSPHPDLILIDGGAAQLRAAVRTLSHQKLVIPTIAIAKQRETLVVLDLEMNKIKRIVLSPRSPARLLLQRIRDEAHRFAIGYQRKLRERMLIKPPP